MYPSFLKNKLKANIVLVGFSGAGKTTIGKKLANRLNYSFIDLDQYFEQKYCFSISHFFQQLGEEYFRKLEHEVLLEVLEKENVVISTGGGTPCFFNSMEIINSKSISIFIEMSPKSLLDRLAHSKKPRPLTSQLSPIELEQYIENKLAERLPFYTQADLTVKGENFNVENLLNDLNAWAQKD
ncbi:MAG: shikimate kinase [Bacteroidales bacterium]|nr:shikimate kinase [Bacteroidales bacterium]